MAYPYAHDIDHCLAANIGDNGVPDDAWARALDGAAKGLDRLRVLKGEGRLPLLALPAKRDDLAPLRPIADRYREYFSDVVVLGTGGSSLGGKALYALSDAGFGPRPGAPRLHFMANIDPRTFAAMARRLRWETTGLIVISKSGGTAETLMQFLSLFPAVFDAAEQDGLKDQVAVITEPADNPLRAFAQRFAIPTLDHDPNLGGRFSALSLVGLLPAMIAGVDVEQVRDGAAQVLDAALGAGSAADPAACPPAAGAAVSTALAKACGISTTVLMPYVDRLAEFSVWHRQLWAESLGKDGQGSTPAPALGAVDQHSQFQLYLDGPADKMFTLIHSACAGTGEDAPRDLARDPRLAYLAGRLMGDLMDAQQRAAAATLIANGRPTRIIKIAEMDAHAMGALMMHFMLETIIAAEIMGVDPFDQPAVEQGKALARRYLSELPLAAR